MSSQADLLATPGLLHAEPDSLDSEFAAIDSNGDGKLSWEETLAFFSKRGVKKNEAHEIFAKADTDGNGYLDRAEFRKLHKMLKNSWYLSPYPRPPPPPPLDALIGKGTTTGLAVAIVVTVVLKVGMGMLRT